ncbi:MAG: hypothetical protein ABJG78_10355 [Cyclobacteriaceae bacterium]
MKQLFVYFYALIFSTIAIAQNGWKWPEDEAQKSKAIEQEAFYKVLIAQSKLEEAMQPLNWLYTNNPQLNPSIYINGVKNLNNIVKAGVDAERKERLQDSILWMYDMRIQHFDDDASTMDRKAYEAFKMYYNKPAKYPMLADLYATAYEMNGPEISYFNLNPYMMLATNFYKTDVKQMSAEKVLDIHTLISDIIDQQRKAGGNEERLKKEQDKVDGFLGSIGDVLNCNFIETKLVPKFREDPADLTTAKKIFSYSVRAKCTDQPYFLEASVTVYESQPTYELAKVLGGKYLAGDEYEKAMEYHTKALELTEVDEEKGESTLALAIASSKLGKKVLARKYAYESLSFAPNDPRAYNLIGNLYFTSFNECQGGESKVIDRGVYLAAYKMYERAGNKAQMQASKEQFPSIEEIFNENFEEGQKITVACWINETVTIARR